MQTSTTYARAAGRPIGALALGRRDAIAAALLALLVATSLAYPFDVGRLLSADALYPIQLLETPFWEYRPPAPNRLLPDVAVHALVGLFVSDLLIQKIAAGSLLLLLLSVVVSATKGTTALLVVLAITCCAGFGSLDSAAHYSLPVSIALIQVARRPSLRATLVFAAVFSDPIVLLPFALLHLLARTVPSRLEILAAAGAFVVNTLYSEFSVSALHLVGVLPVWVAGFWTARRLGLLRLACFGAAVVLVLAGWVDIIPARYGLPVVASIALLFFETRCRVPDWRAFAWPAAFVAVFVATMDTARARQLDAAFGCLSALLPSRGIEVIAADHWTAKPLAFANAAAGRASRITQVSFDDGRLHPWMAPRSAYGPQTVWGLGNRDTCAKITTEQRYCGQATVAPVLSSEKVCGIFDLYRYAVPLPLVAEARPATKLDAIGRNLGLYIEKATGFVRRRLGAREGSPA